MDYPPVFCYQISLLKRFNFLFLKSLSYQLLFKPNVWLVQVESILDKDNYTLEELLDEDEIIQECKSLNGRLINLYATIWIWLALHILLHHEIVIHYAWKYSLLSLCLIIAFSSLEEYLSRIFKCMPTFMMGSQATMFMIWLFWH